MKRTGDDRSRIELFLGKNSSDFDRMREVRIPRLTLLAAVGLHGKDVGAIQAWFVGALIVAAHPLDAFVLPHHDDLSGRHGAAGEWVVEGRRRSGRVEIGGRAYGKKKSKYDVDKN